MLTDSRTYHLTLGDTEIYGFSTGLLGIKQNHYEARSGGRYWRLLRILLSPQFAPPIPVFVWLIVHPEGIFLIDTGETARANAPDFFPPGERGLWQKNFRFYLDQADEAGTILTRIGLQPADVQTVVLTHAHMDHTDGMNAFPNATILFSAAELALVNRFGSSAGCVPKQWSKSLTIRGIGYQPDHDQPFEQSYPLTKAGDLLAIPTIGHTLGHQSILLQKAGLTLLFAGDVSFTDVRLRHKIADGMTTNIRLLQRTQQQLLDFMAQTPTVYLPTHDPQAGYRLENRVVFGP